MSTHCCSKKPFFFFFSSRQPIFIWLSPFWWLPFSAYVLSPDVMAFTLRALISQTGLRTKQEERLQEDLPSREVAQRFPRPAPQALTVLWIIALLSVRQLPSCTPTAKKELKKKQTQNVKYAPFPSQQEEQRVMELQRLYPSGRLWCKTSLVLSTRHDKSHQKLFQRQWS